VRSRVRNRHSFLVALVLSAGIVILASNGAEIRAQELPGKIRGYKVKRTEVSVNGSNPGASVEVDVNFDHPRPVSISLSGFSFELESSLVVSGQSGNVDFIAFRDFELNGIRIEIKEFNEGFEFQNGVSLDLPKPIEIRVSGGQALKGALSELKKRETEWRVKGRIFVFGKFRRFGFRFKRVVPVDIDLSIPNPLPTGLFSSQSDGDLRSDTSVVEKQGDIAIDGLPLGQLRQF